MDNREAREAIELLRDTPIDIRSTREDDIYTLYATAQLTAIEALWKQIPVKVYRKADDDTCVYYHFACPNCLYDYGYTKTIKSIYGTDVTHCPICGQAIDWSDEE